MCLPAAALPIAALASSVISAGGAIYGGLAAKAQGKYEQNVANANAALDREQIMTEQENTKRQALNHWRKVAQIKGQQRAAAAAGGVSTDFGTASDILTDTDMLASEDANIIYQSGNNRVRGLDRSVSNNIASGRAARSRGNAAFVGSLFQAGSTMLGGASQYRTLKGNV